MSKTPKRHRGRRSKLTPEIQERIVSAIRAGNYAGVSAEYSGISVSTFYAWLQKGRERKTGAYREFLEAVKKAEREAEVRAVAMVQKHMADDWKAAMTYLERKFPDRWSRRERLQLEVEPRKVLTSLLDLQNEELDAAVDLATGGGDLDGESG